MHKKNELEKHPSEKTVDKTNNITPYKIAILVLKYGIVQSILTYILTPARTGGWVNYTDPEGAIKVFIWTISISLVLASFQFIRGIWRKGDMTSRIIVYLILAAIFLFLLYSGENTQIKP